MGRGAGRDAVGGVVAGEEDFVALGLAVWGVSLADKTGGTSDGSVANSGSTLNALAHLLVVWLSTGGRFIGGGPVEPAAAATPSPRALFSDACDIAEKSRQHNAGDEQVCWQKGAATDTCARFTLIRRSSSHCIPSTTDRWIA